MRAARGPARGWRGRGPRCVGGRPRPLTLELALSRPPPSHCPGRGLGAGAPSAGTRVGQGVGPAPPPEPGPEVRGPREAALRHLVSGLLRTPLPSGSVPAVQGYLLPLVGGGGGAPRVPRGACPPPARAGSGQGGYVFSFRMLGGGVPNGRAGFDIIILNPAQKWQGWGLGTPGSRGPSLPRSLHRQLGPVVSELRGAGGLKPREHPISQVPELTHPLPIHSVHFRNVFSMSPCPHTIHIITGLHSHIAYLKVHIHVTHRYRSIYM